MSIRSEFAWCVMHSDRHCEAVWKYYHVGTIDSPSNENINDDGERLG